MINGGWNIFSVGYPGFTPVYALKKFFLQKSLASEVRRLHDD